jgi:hypothetical protein
LDKSLEASALADAIIDDLAVGQGPYSRPNVYPEYKQLSLLTLMRNLSDINHRYDSDLQYAIGALKGISDRATLYRDGWKADKRWEAREDRQVNILSKTVSRACRVTT